MRTVLEIVSLSVLMFIFQSVGLLMLVASWKALLSSYREKMLGTKQSAGTIILLLVGAIFGLGPGLLILCEANMVFITAEALVLAVFFFLVRPIFLEVYHDGSGGGKTSVDLFAGLFAKAVPGEKTAWWKRIAAGTVNALVVAAYLMAFNSISNRFVDTADLATLMKIEGLVIHSFPFMAIIGLARPQTWRGKGVQWYLFAGMFGLYMIAALDQGAAGFMMFVTATAFTYLGFILNFRSSGAHFHLLKRWIASYVFYLLWLLILRMDNDVGTWHAGKQLFGFGFMYFLSLSIAELSGVYDYRLKKLVAKKDE